MSSLTRLLFYIIKYMANDYTGIKKVRFINGDDFINDFVRVGTIVALVKATDAFFEVKKQGVWAQARKSKIVYLMSTDVYKNNRLVMVIV